MATLAVVEHLSGAELGRRHRAARDRVERGHLQVVWLLVQGRSRGEVARIMGWSGVWVAEIVRRYNEAGAEGLGDRRRGNAGAKPLLGEADEAALRAGRAGRAARRRRAVDRPQGRGLDERPARAGGVAAAGVGLSPQARLQPAGAEAAARQGGEPGRAGGI